MAAVKTKGPLKNIPMGAFTKWNSKENKILNGNQKSFKPDTQNKTFLS